MNDVEISVVCNTYNQVSYIDRALSSLVSQVTNVPFEIIVHDDCSTDGTQNVIRRYEEEYPKLVRAFYEKENQYSKGKNITRDLLLQFIRGKYIALCEGDDFWIDNAKLQKQWEIMQNYLKCDMCACRSIIVSENGEDVIGEIRPNCGDGVLSPESVIAGGGRYVATPSLFYRKRLYDYITTYEAVLSFDYTLQIKGSLRGGIYYIDEAMAAYRDLAKGSWSVNVARNKNRIKAHNEREINMLKALDVEMGGKYHTIIDERIKHGYVPFTDQLDHNKQKLISDEKFEGKVYLWGLGMRGEAFEEFCDKYGIKLSGVCDKKNLRIGELSSYGNIIFECDYVLKNAEVICASTERIYKSLLELKIEGNIVNLQKYMPWG